MMPTVHTRLRNLPAWRHGSYWGCGEGIEWTIGRPNPIGLMLRTEYAFFDCNNWALRFCFLYFSIYVEINMPWYVSDRKLFVAWYPARLPGWGRPLRPGWTAYIEWGPRLYDLIKLKVIHRWEYFLRDS